MSEAASDAAADGRRRLRKTHLRFGWWSLLVYLSLGLALELLHGLKLGLYLDLANATRRLLWTLSHAHGTLLSVLVLCFAATVEWLPDWRDERRGLASLCLRAATILMPLGFFLGGIFIHGGDPGLGILLVLPGGIALATAVLLTALAAGVRD